MESVATYAIMVAIEEVRHQRERNERANVNKQRASSTRLAQQLADVFQQTAEDHHIVYAATDGVDPDWSIWYAGHLLDLGIEQMLDAKLLRSDLIYLLVLADKQQNLDAPGARGERYYADFFLSRYRR